ncbi:MAG: hypothetical protein ABIG84_03010 [archaeon]
MKVGVNNELIINTNTMDKKKYPKDSMIVSTTCGSGVVLSNSPLL